MEVGVKNGKNAKNILIVDDNERNRKLLRVHLENQRFEVLEAKDGMEALRFFDKPDAPSLAIVDWKMPKMDGIEFCKRIRNDLQIEHCYIIFLTVKNQEDDVIQGLDSGANDYIIQPFNAAELLSRVQIGVRHTELYQRLNQRVSELENYNRKIAVLNEMGELLRSSITIEETQGIFSRYLAKLFPNESGELYILQDASKLFKSVATWGTQSNTCTCKLLNPNECWSLRQKNRIWWKSPRPKSFANI
jgi:DNA-binding response OmpR family regulator